MQWQLLKSTCSREKVEEKTAFVLTHLHRKWAFVYTFSIFSSSLFPKIVRKHLYCSVGEIIRKA